MRRMLCLLAGASVLTACSGSGTHGETASTHAVSSSANVTSGPAAPFDVVAENRKPGTTAWRMGKNEQANDTQMAGFVDHDSVLPGTPLVLRATTDAPAYTVRAFRMGWYAGTGGRLIWTSASLHGVAQPHCPVGAGKMVDCSGWKPSVTIATTGWPPGLYLLKLTTTTGKSKWVPLTVRSSSARGKVLIVNATPTYQAYNAYGGYSLYTGPGGFGDRATTVSFNRPYDRSGARLVTAGERQITALAEKLGLATAYATQLDINRDPHLLDGARMAVSLSHDEYWSLPMRDAWESARDHGTNLAFFGANVSYWRIRATDRTITSYKSASADPVAAQADTTAQWRQQPKPRPENALTGLLYECFPARGALEVSEPGFWAFAGTGATQGSRYNGLIGPEIDRAYPIAGTPASLEVAAHTPVACATQGLTYSDLSYYTAASGAGVFASGSMLFAVGVLGTNAPTGIDQRASAFATQVASNVLTEMAKGPAGKRHPARPNLASLDAGVSTSSGTGGPVG